MGRLTDIVTGVLAPLVPGLVGLKINRNSYSQLQALWTQSAYDKNPERYKRARAISPIIMMQNGLLAAATEVFTLDMAVRGLRDSKLDEKDLIPLWLAYIIRTVVYNHERRLHNRARTRLKEINTPEVQERMQAYDSYWRQRA